MLGFARGKDGRRPLVEAVKRMASDGGLEGSAKSSRQGSNRFEKLHRWDLLNQELAAFNRGPLFPNAHLGLRPVVSQEHPFARANLEFAEDQGFIL